MLNAHMTKLLSRSTAARFCRLSMVFATLLMPCLAAPTLPSAHAQNLPTIGVDEIKPGMKGYGLTVFRGTKPEKFDIEVIDVLHNFRPDQDLILIKTPHPILNQAASVAGMSGSPIFINGKLAGAYAYGWAFSKDPIVGVTPIASMMRDFNRKPALLDADNKSTAKTAKSNTATQTALNALSGQNTEAYVSSLLSQPKTSTSETAVRTNTPLLLGGFTDKMVEQMRGYFEPLGIVPMQAGGSATKPVTRTKVHVTKEATEKPAFENGGAIAVQLIRGDLSANAIGTVTMVDGHRLIAFGHPMFDAGETGLPVATAKVIHVLSSTGRSFKIAEALEPLGSLVQDRQSCIVADTARKPIMVPVTLRLHGIGNAARTTWNMEVVDHPNLTPFFVFAALNNAMQTASNDQDDVQFQVISKVKVKGHGTVTVDDRGFLDGEDRGQMFSALRLLPLLQLTYSNPFERAHVQGVEVDVHVKFTRAFTEVMDISVGSSEVDPGEKVPVHIRLRTFGKPEYTRVEYFEVPKHLAGQTFEIAIEPGARVVRPFAQPRKLDEIYDIVNHAFPATSVVMTARMPAQGMQFRGQVVENLPASTLGSLRMSNETSYAASFTVRSFKEIPIGEPVMGSAAIRLSVRELPRSKK